MSAWEKLKGINLGHSNQDCNLMVLNRNELLFVPDNNGINKSVMPAWKMSSSNQHDYEDDSEDSVYPDADEYSEEDSDEEIITGNEYNRLFGAAPAIWKYNIKQNEWIKWIEIPANYRGLWSGHTSSLDSQNMILYIFGTEQNVIKIDLNTKEITYSKRTRYEQLMVHSKSMVIDNTFHVFCRWKERRLDTYYWTHYIYDDESNDLRMKFRFNAYQFSRDRDVSVMYLSSQKTILIWPNGTNMLYYYSLITNNLTRKKIKNACVQWLYARLTTDERYIIFFADTVAIVMDLQTMIVWDTNIDGIQGIMCPICIKDDDITKELLMNGFIRESWKLSEYKLMRYPPVYLIKIMQKYVNLEVIYCLDDDEFNRIKVDDILSDKELYGVDDLVDDDMDPSDPNYFIVKGALLTYKGKHVIIKEVDKSKNVCSVALPSFPGLIYETGVLFENVIHSISPYENMGSILSVKIVYGNLSGKVGTLIGYDQHEAVLQLTSTTEVTIIDIKFIVIYIDY